LSFGSFWTALAGNLISPSRGLLVFVPVTLFVSYLLIRYWRALPCRPLVVLSLAIIAAHTIVVSGFVPWYGGHSYGPRFMASVVPWLTLLGILALKARATWRYGRPEAGSTAGLWIETLIGCLLLSCSIGINGRGATAQSTWLWNIRPVNVDQSPERLWDWRHPQFLA
jgi:hypothetical protein